MFIGKRIWFLSSIAFIISGLSFYIIYMNMIPSVDLKKSQPDISVEEYVNQNIHNKISELQPNIQKINENIPTVQSNSSRITPYTEMVFQYYYEEDGKIVEESIEPPYFLIDLTRDEVQQKYSDWQISYFSNQRVVMKKNISSRSPFHFIVGIHEGYIAIFYDNGSGELELKEITETPISSLPEEEQNKLREGIRVYGEETLIRLLEDYTS